MYARAPRQTTTMPAAMSIGAGHLHFLFRSRSRVITRNVCNTLGLYLVSEKNHCSVYVFRAQLEALSVVTEEFHPPNTLVHPGLGGPLGHSPSPDTYLPI